MNGEAGEIELRLRRRIQALVRESPGLRAEYNLAHGARRPSPWKIMLRTIAACFSGPMLCVGLPIVMLLVYEQVGGLDFAFAVWSLWALGIMFCVADGVLRTIWISPLARLLQHLPVEDGQVVRRAIRETASWSALGMLVGAWGFGFVAWRLALPPTGWIVAALFLVVQWVTAAAAGVALARSCPKSWYLTAAAWAMFAMMIAMFAGAIRGNAASSIANALYLLTPGGWAAAAWRFGFLRGARWAWLGLAPTVFILYRFAIAYREWPKLHAAIESLPPRPSRATRGPAADEEGVVPAFSWSEWFRWVRGDADGSNDTLPDPGLVARTIRARTYLQPQNTFEARLWELLCRRMLSPR
jgi:hypothetical protein